MPTKENPDTVARPARVLGRVARGLVMGAADVVPGISGGTVALVLGIYYRLLGALDAIVRVVRSVLTGQWSRLGADARAVPWLWLGGLVAGIGTAIVLLSAPITAALQAYPVHMAGLFLGLIVAAIVLCWRQLAHRNVALAAIVVASGVVSFWLLGLPPSPSAGSDSPLWAFFFAGAVAICAMILPGISGSFILVLLGMYSQVIGAVAERNLAIVGVFGAGAVLGLAVSSAGLKWLLDRYHDIVLAAMIGLMVGSVRILWPWPGGLDSTEIAALAGEGVAITVGLAVAGAALVLGLDAIALRRRARAALREASPAVDSLSAHAVQRDN